MGNCVLDLFKYQNEYTKVITISVISSSNGFYYIVILKSLMFHPLYYENSNEYRILSFVVVYKSKSNNFYFLSFCHHYRTRISKSREVNEMMVATNANKCIPWIIFSVLCPITKEKIFI